ncbi:DUF4136 domain-containing protein [Myroides sp. LJL116]
MRALKFLPLAFLLLFITACSSVKVTTDYDTAIDFSQYKTYAFLKEGIDHVKINDIDKKRILSAIEQNLQAKGFVKSNTNPDLLINLVTKSKEQVNITTVNNNNFYSPWGYYRPGWGPYWGPNSTTVSTQVQGTLFVDILDTKSKMLVWQGIGTGVISNTNNMKKREERIQEFVKDILSNFPPGTKN